MKRSMTKDIQDDAKSAGLEECHQLILNILERIDTVLEWTSELQKKQAFSDERITRLDRRLDDIEQCLRRRPLPEKPNDRKRSMRQGFTKGKRLEIKGKT